MAKPAQYWQSRDLKDVDYQGLIREDVMDQIFDISRIPLPFSDLVGSDTADNSYTEWTTDRLADPALGGFVVDGSDHDRNDAKGGKRMGNHCGILTKEVQVSRRAQDSDTIGRSNELSYQVMMRQRELRRNVEATALSNQGSQDDNGDDEPGIPAGLASQITMFDNGSGAVAGAFAAGHWTGLTPGTPTALTETDVRDALQEAWEGGADPQVLMSVPGVIRALSEYMFTSSSRIATLTRETRDVGSGGAGTAMGSVNVFITDFGVTVDFLPNRIQRMEATWTLGAVDEIAAVETGGAGVFILDPAFARMSFLTGYSMVPLAKTGLTDKRLMFVDWTVKALNPDAHRYIPSVDPTAEVTFEAA
ncbi:MAG: DUF5309 family protein [Amaricoccus sp.]|uniref:SU10 major capsid protein n=1 Tax=Amaricoccus sp. TaxID=1872485 RepID=UPI0039E56614